MFYAFLILLIFYPLASYARPISYVGGTTVMQMNNGDENMLHVNYTFNPKASAGIFSVYDKDEKYLANSVILNNRLYRYNGDRSQINLYLENAVGQEHSYQKGKKGEDGFYAMNGISADAEDRRFYGAYEAHYTHNDADIAKNYFEQKVRAGVAPYIGNSGDLHSWLILELDHKPSKDDNFRLTPFVRFFKGDVLTEIGANEDGDVMFNWIYRF